MRNAKCGCLTRQEFRFCNQKLDSLQYIEKRHLNAFAIPAINFILSLPAKCALPQIIIIKLFMHRDLCSIYSTRKYNNSDFFSLLLMRNEQNWEWRRVKISISANRESFLILGSHEHRGFDLHFNRTRKYNNSHLAKSTSPKFIIFYIYVCVRDKATWLAQHTMNTNYGDSVSYKIAPFSKRIPPRNLNNEWVDWINSVCLMCNLCDNCVCLCTIFIGYNMQTIIIE